MQLALLADQSDSSPINSVTGELGYSVSPNFPIFVLNLMVSSRTYDYPTQALGGQVPLIHVHCGHCSTFSQLLVIFSHSTSDAQFQW